MSATTNDSGSRAPREGREPAQSTGDSTPDHPAAEPAAQLPSAPDTGNKRLTLVTAGGFGALLTSSVTQAFKLVPEHLYPALDGTSAAVAGLALGYIVCRMIPRKGSVRLDWEIK